MRAVRSKSDYNAFARHPGGELIPYAVFDAYSINEAIKLVSDQEPGATVLIDVTSPKPQREGSAVQ